MEDTVHNNASTGEPNVDERIYALVLKVLQHPDSSKDRSARITSKTRFHHLNYDALDLMDLVMECEDEFDMDVEEEEESRLGDYLSTVGEFIDFIRYKLDPSGKRPDVLTKRWRPWNRIGPMPTCGKSFGLPADYCPVASAIGISISAITFFVTSAVTGRPIDKTVLAVLALAILALFAYVLLNPVLGLMRVKKLLRSKRNGTVDNRPISSLLPKPPNTNLIAAVFVPAVLAALLVTAFILDWPNWIIWPMTAAYAAGFVGFLAFKYSQNWPLLLVSFTGASCLAKGGLGTTVAIKAHSNSALETNQNMGLEFLFSTSALIDASMILAGASLLAFAFSKVYCPKPTEPA